MRLNNLNKKIKPMVISMIIGMVIGGFIILGIVSFIDLSDHHPMNTHKPNEQKPIYWVAPMDANYKKEHPGKSPMGMDLVPVYADVNKDKNESPGTVRISSDVVNNLGVRTAEVKYKPLHTDINTVGYVAYDEEKLVHIHSRVEGWVEKLYVKAVGDPIEKNQPLYEIYSPELVNAQEELLVALASKNARLINAAENRLTTLQFPQSAIVTLKKTNKVQQRITFYAPQKGVLEDLKIREGFYVKPSLTLMSIVDLAAVWVKTEVFERQASQVKVGAPITMKLDYLPGKTWQGKVDYIYPTLDAKTRTVNVRLRLNNDKKELKPNMFAQIVIHTKEDKPVLLIPKEALIRTGNQDRVVIALGEGRFKSVEVSVGRFAKDNVEILDGLNKGDKIVSSAQFLLDSESSKSSDFTRMNSDNINSDKYSPLSVWVQAKIESVMPDHKMLTITHQAISEWDWPKMTMDFITYDSVDFSKLNEGLILHVEITKTVNEDYQISNIHIPDKPTMSHMDISQPTHSEQHHSTSNEDAVVDHSNH